MNYLTEQSLKPILETRFDNVVTQHRLENRKIVDFYMPDDKLVVEFDGSRHYQEFKTIERDLQNNLLLTRHGIRVVHVPYWLQAEFVMPFYFGNREYRHSEEPYPNGFVDKKCVRPMDFSIQGWDRFVYELSALPKPIREEVQETMTIDEINTFDYISSTRPWLFEVYDSLQWMSGCSL